MSWALVAAGAAVGAPLRYLVDRAVRERVGDGFPWGVFAVNIVGCLLLGLLTGAARAGAAGESLRLLVGTGLCGALTTYSTFSYDTLRLAEEGEGRLAAWNVAGSVGSGLVAGLAGIALARALLG